jgi:DNA-binding beta-propeller fold protein YncE
MRRIAALSALALAALASAALASLASGGPGASAELRGIDGTVWVANRGAHAIRGYDADTGIVVREIDMAPASQPGDLAYARGKLYVAEEFGTPPAIAIVDPGAGAVLGRIPMAAGSRPHHVHTSRGGRLVAFGLYGTDDVAVVDTRTDTLLGPWDTNPAPGAESGRAHAAVFSPNGRTLFVASDASNEVVALDPRTGEVLWRLAVPGAHELAVTRNGKTAYVARRTANRLSVIDLSRPDAYTDVLTLQIPDTLQLAAGDRLLTVGLRAMPAQVAVVDTRTLEYELVRIGPFADATTIAGHQWTSRHGRYTFAAFEGGGSPGVDVIDHRDGNRVVASFPYLARPGGTSRPHGVTFAPVREDDEDDCDDEDDADD